MGKIDKSSFSAKHNQELGGSKQCIAFHTCRRGARIKARARLLVMGQQSINQPASGSDETS